jgi:hypothetical protein
MSSEVRNKSRVPVPEGVVELWMGQRAAESPGNQLGAKTFGKNHIIPQFKRKCWRIFFEAQLIGTQWRKTSEGE